MPTIIIRTAIQSFRLGLGVAAVYAFPWIMFFGSGFSPSSTTPMQSIMLWAIHLVVMGLATIVFYFIVKARNEELRFLFNADSIRIGVIGMAVTSVALAVTAYFEAPLAATVALVALYSLFYAHAQMLISFNISQTSIHIVSIAVPASLTIAGVFLGLALVSGQIVSIIECCLLLPAIIWYKNLVRSDLPEDVAQHINAFKSDPANEVLFVTNNRKPALTTLVVCATVVCMQVVSQLHLGIDAGGNNYFVLFVPFGGFVTFLFVLIRSADLSLQKLCFAIGMLVVTSLLFTGQPSIPLMRVGLICSLCAWACVECFYWTIFVGRSSVVTSGGALLIYARTRSFVHLAMFAGVLLATLMSQISQIEIVENDAVSAIISAALACILLAALFFLLRRSSGNGQATVVEQAAEPDEEVQEDPYLRRIDQFCEMHKKDFTFTKREREILEFLLMGRPTANIAQTLFISTNTVKGHISHIYDKVGVRKRGDLITMFEEDTKQ